MSRPVGATLPDGSAHQEQRLSTQVDRQRWDAEWIAGQRLTTDVIRAAPRDGSDDRSAERPATESSATEPTRFEPLRMPVRSSSTEPETGSSLTERKPETQSNSVPLRRSPDVTASTATATPPESESDAPVEKLTSSTANPRTSGARSHFALWRSDDAVRVAMRLRDPDAQAGGIVAVLREWLRGAGLTLAQIIVNGRSQGASTPAEGRPAGKTRSTLNTRI